MSIPDLPRLLRQILSGTECLTASSAFDPISARIAHSLGFEVGVMGGSVASYAVLGAPDLILLTMSELVEQARRVCRATSLRLIVDADHGYGNALNVMRTVQELQAAGVAGVTIEDTLLPRAFGSPAAPQLVSLEEGVGKMKAALKGRGAGEALVFGRTSAASITGVDDAIRRLRAYETVGVDALFVPGLKTRSDRDRIAEAVTVPTWPLRIRWVPSARWSTCRKAGPRRPLTRARSLWPAPRSGRRSPVNRWRCTAGAPRWSGKRACAVPKAACARWLRRRSSSSTRSRDLTRWVTKP